MPFVIGRDFAEVQILKKWHCPYLLNGMEYFDEILHTHWYWQDLGHGITKCHLPLDEALPRSKMWKIETGPLSWTLLNIVMKFGIHIDIDNL